VFFKYRETAKGVMMKKLLIILSLFALVLTLSNCERKGTVTDIARIKQADRATKMLKNALEEYYLEHNTYPAEGVNIKETLLPYIQKTATADGDSVSKWDTEIQPSFSDVLVYSSKDPKTNYFLKTKATDINKTPVFIRPSIIRKTEEEEKEKKKK